MGPLDTVFGSARREFGKPLLKLTPCADQGDQDSDGTMLRHWESQIHSHGSCIVLAGVNSQQKYDSDLLHNDNDM